MKKYRLEILRTQDETIVAPTYELELVTIPRLRCDITLCTGSGCLRILRLHGGTRPEILSLATEQTNWILSSSLLSKAELVMGFSARCRRKSFYQMSWALTLGPINWTVLTPKGATLASFLIGKHLYFRKKPSHTLIER